MDYLLTWVEGEEVGYKFLKQSQLRGVKIESDKKYSLTELRTGREICDVKHFVEDTK